MNLNEVKVIRSRRKTLAVQITRNMEIVVKAPLQMSNERIITFLKEKEHWIDSHLAKMKENRASSPVVGDALSYDDIKDLADQALAYIPPRAKEYAAKIGVTFGRITIRNQTTRWGSCSSKGNLNFNCLLMLCPKEVIDSVIVHELCHRKYMNHSDAFYREVLRVFPNYWACDEWLKKNGPVILNRMTGG
ncbi:MAG: M48 family metallopeptidase [Solobacterium sp.]|nr:M48 family metallopeptidase [Solobacterium sp.]